MKERILFLFCTLLLVACGGGGDDGGGGTPSGGSEYLNVSNVDIPGVFAVYNGMSDNLMLPDPSNKRAKGYKEKKKEFLKRYATLASGTDASVCVMCNACLPKCPQRIRIPEQMRMIHKLVKDLG